MSRLNNIIKFALLNLNIFLCFIGTFFIGFAFYLWFANWGSLGTNFFIGLGFVSALLGLVLGLVSCMGCQGINNQTRKFGGTSYWTGRRMIALHLICLILGLIGEVYVLKTALDATQQYSDVKSQLTLNPIDNWHYLEYPPYAPYERVISEKFNRFFFGAASACKSKTFSIPSLTP